MKAETQDFFNLPIEKKNKYWQRPGDIEGFGQLFIASGEQKLDWGQGFTIFTLLVHLKKPCLFPELPLPFSFSMLSQLLYRFHFQSNNTTIIGAMFHPSNNSTALTARGTLEIYLTEAECLSLKMLDQMAKALRMDPNEMKELFEEVVQSKG